MGVHRQPLPGARRRLCRSACPQIETDLHDYSPPASFSSSCRIVFGTFRFGFTCLFFSSPSQRGASLERRHSVRVAPRSACMSHATTAETNAAAGASTLLAARQQATASACVPKPDVCCVPDALSWMNNDAGQNPCTSQFLPSHRDPDSADAWILCAARLRRIGQQLQSVMQLCTPSFGIQVLPNDLSCPLNSTSGVPNPCCCSTVSYAVRPRFNKLGIVADIKPKSVS